MSCLQALANMTTLLLIGDELVWVKHLIGGAVMLAFAYVDSNHYKFYPLEASIFIDVSGRDKGDLHNFNQINQYLQAH